jgi:protein-S-isoprenylcysteine O-methyltransferase Ste14
VAFFVVIAALLFILGGGLGYWQAWLFLAAFFGPATAITVYLARHDPKLLERRMKAGPAAERDPLQKLVQVVASVTFFACLIVPALDHRFGWSRLPATAAVAGDLMLLLGILISFLVLRENTFASAVIEVDAEQIVISTGPYAVVRHPMYSGAALMMIGTPISLGSWWGLPASLALTVAIIWRLFEEERTLARDLDGYSAYLRKVRWRLIPGVF